MRARPVGVAAVLLAMTVAACSSPLGTKYEYEEQLYLSVNGGATVVIDASLPSLVALRGLAVDPVPRGRVDRNAVRALYENAGCPDVRVGQPWTRQGRHFISVRVTTNDVRTLAACGPLSWSSYQFEKKDDLIYYTQRIGAAANGALPTVNWDGSEIVGFKLHLPSKIVYHNVRRLKDGTTGDVDRGNILTFEQRLADRRAGQPLALEVRMGAQSILFQTLYLFGGAFAAAVLLLVFLIWLTVRRGKKMKIAPSRD